MKKSLFSILALAFLLTACGPGNIVHLVNPPMDGSVLPAPNAPHVSVVRFEDKRLEQNAIGVRRDQSAFETQDDVCQWISKAIADELIRHGFRVSYAQTIDQARRARPDYLITGDVQEAWLKETSMTDLESSLRVQFTIANREKRLSRETTASSRSRAGMPSGSATDDILKDNLMDLVQRAGQKISAIIRSK